MIDLSRVQKYYVACGYTDMRRGIDGLAAIVSARYGQEPREDSLFLFCGRRTDRIKALYYSGDGYVLVYKRLTNGAFQWPRSEQELRLLDARSFRWLMEGLKPDQPRAIQKGKTKDAHIYEHKAPPRLLKHSLASPSSVADIMTRKYVDGLPLARQDL